MKLHPSGKTGVFRKMKNLLPPAIALILGIGIGLLLTRPSNEANASPEAESQSQDDSASSNSRTRPPSRNAAAAKSTTGKKGPAPRSIAALMELTREDRPMQNSIAFLEAVERLGAEEIAAMLVDLEKFDPNDPRGYQITSALINRWAAIDPDGAWDAAIHFSHKNLKRQMIASVIGEISQSDLGKARRMLSEIKDPQTKQYALYSFINQAASADPEEAFQVLVSDFKNSERSGYYDNLFQKWAKDDPNAAIAKLSQIKGNSERQQALGGIARALITSDPQRALDLLGDMPPGQGRSSMLYSISSTWMNHDPDAAIAWVHSLDSVDKSTAIQNITSQLAQEDPAKAAVLLASMPLTSQNSYQFSNLAGQWARQDPEAARKWAESLPPGQAKQQALSEIIGHLAQSDPVKAATYFGDTIVTNQNSGQVGMIVGAWVKTDQTAALAWLESLDLRGDAQRNVHSQFLHNWVNENASAASRYALGIQDEKSRQQAISSLVGAWGNNDPIAAKEWIMASLQGDSKNTSLNSLIQILSHRDFPTALKYYQEATANLTSEVIDKTFGSTASQIASNWVQHDPKAAGQWVMSLPEGETRSNSMRSMVDEFGDYDIKGAAEFVSTLPAGKDRDQAVTSLVSDLGYQGDSESAFDWAASISDQAKREGAIRNAVNRWKESDPAAARAAVAAADISPAAREKILKSLQD